ncbi:uncharacterized protein EAF01_006573 [Botrytis porri]|uniref:uncharacterized protein n=1 Tax=Botrytis porri TaxID=87229 RepID=UPI0019001AB2|nr:uncharacterized protein EAF01_006573 [Botrytis porri]KAF7903524.1 hypothetical protein EAF01_006573 [Botrytis porri]
MSANNFNLLEQNEVQVVCNQDQEQQSDSDDMVNVGELNIELRLKITELRLEITEQRLGITELRQELTQTLVRSARLEERNNQLIIRINEREKCIQKSDVVLAAVLAFVLAAVLLVLMAGLLGNH